MALTIFPKVQLNGVGAVAARLIRFLIGNDALGGGTWSLLYACDAGTRTDAPSDPHDVSTLNPANAWCDADGSSLATGDWFVVRSGLSATGHYFELFVQVGVFSGSVTDALYFKMITLADNGGTGAWSYTGTSGTLGTIFATPPAGCVPINAGYKKWKIGNTLNSFSFWVDDATFIGLSDVGGPGATATLMYVGELTNTRSADTRPFVLYAYGDSLDGTYCDASSGSIMYNRLSPVDNVTVLESGYYTALYNTTGGYMHASTQDKVFLGESSILPIGVEFTTPGHLHFAGFFKHMWGVNQAALGPAATLANRAYLCRGTSTTMPGLAFPWDSTTEYP